MIIYFEKFKHVLFFSVHFDHFIIIKVIRFDLRILCLKSKFWFLTEESTNKCVTYLTFTIVLLKYE